MRRQILFVRHHGTLARHHFLHIVEQELDTMHFNQWAKTIHQNSIRRINYCQIDISVHVWQSMSNVPRLFIPRQRILDSSFHVKKAKMRKSCFSRFVDDSDEDTVVLSHKIARFSHKLEAIYTVVQQNISLHESNRISDIYLLRQVVEEAHDS